jgi:hypothetical protein
MQASIYLTCTLACIHEAVCCSQNRMMPPFTACQVLPFPLDQVACGAAERKSGVSMIYNRPLVFNAAFEGRRRVSAMPRNRNRGAPAAWLGSALAGASSLTYLPTAHVAVEHILNHAVGCIGLVVVNVVDVDVGGAGKIRRTVGTADSIWMTQRTAVDHQMPTPNVLLVLSIGGSTIHTMKDSRTYNAPLITLHHPQQSSPPPSQQSHTPPSVYAPRSDSA